MLRTRHYGNGQNNYKQRGGTGDTALNVTEPEHLEVLNIKNNFFGEDKGFSLRIIKFILDGRINIHELFSKKTTLKAIDYATAPMSDDSVSLLDGGLYKPGDKFSHKASTTIKSTPPSGKTELIDFATGHGFINLDVTTIGLAFFNKLMNGIDAANNVPIILKNFLLACLRAQITDPPKAGKGKKYALNDKDDAIIADPGTSGTVAVAKFFQTAKIIDTTDNNSVKNALKLLAVISVLRTHLGLATLALVKSEVKFINNKDAEEFLEILDTIPKETFDDKKNPDNFVFDMKDIDIETILTKNTFPIKGGNPGQYKMSGGAIPQVATSVPGTGNSIWGYSNTGMNTFFGFAGAGHVAFIPIVYNKISTAISNYMTTPSSTGSTSKPNQRYEVDLLSKLVHQKFADVYTLENGEYKVRGIDNDGKTTKAVGFTDKFNVVCFKNGEEIAGCNDTFTELAKPGAALTDLKELENLIKDLNTKKYMEYSVDDIKEQLVKEYVLTVLKPSGAGPGPGTGQNFLMTEGADHDTISKSFHAGLGANLRRSAISLLHPYHWEGEVNAIPTVDINNPPFKDAKEGDKFYSLTVDPKIIYKLFQLLKFKPATGEDPYPSSKKTNVHIIERVSAWWKRVQGNPNGEFIDGSFHAAGSFVKGNGSEFVKLINDNNLGFLRFLDVLRAIINANPTLMNPGYVPPHLISTRVSTASKPTADPRFAIYKFIDPFKRTDVTGLSFNVKSIASGIERLRKSLDRQLGTDVPFSTALMSPTMGMYGIQGSNAMFSPNTYFMSGGQFVLKSSQPIEEFSKEFANSPFSSKVLEALITGLNAQLDAISNGNASLSKTTKESIEKKLGDIKSSEEELSKSLERLSKVFEVYKDSQGTYNPMSKITTMDDIDSVYDEYKNFHRVARTHARGTNKVLEVMEKFSDAVLNIVNNTNSGTSGYLQPIN